MSGEDRDAGRSAVLKGTLGALSIRADEAGLAHYDLRVDDQKLSLNKHLGTPLEISVDGAIHCINCQRPTRKSFGQGHCWRCFTTLARCDTCMMSPERCHYFQGTCREPAWGERYCFTPHLVYLANASAPKVGITRATNLPGRWLNQGATQGLGILGVATRQQSGFVEALFRQEISDRTSWQRMLKGPPERVDLYALRDRLIERLSPGLEALRARFGEHAITPIEAPPAACLDYPALRWPEKVRSHNLDRTPRIEGTLIALKGQYLLLDSGVINLRKYAGYRVTIRVGAGQVAPRQDLLI